MLSEIFWGSFITAVLGFLLVTVKLCYKSKCDEIDICGIKVHRVVDMEDIEVANSTI